jgi:hypothetical protein
MKWSLLLFLMLVTVFLLAVVLYRLRQIIRTQTVGKRKRGVRFTIRIGGISILKGRIKKMKAEYGFNLDVEATPVGGAAIEAGSAAWGYAATDADGNDVSGQFLVTPDPDNELKCNLKHDGSQSESTGVLTLRADGDPDADETAPVVGTLDIIVDAPNVTGFELSATPHVDEPPA